MRRMKLAPICVSTFLSIAVAPPSRPFAAEFARGNFIFSSARNCASSGKLSAELCALAERNAAAEFEEKAPRFPHRDLCEKAFGAGACSLGFRGADGGAGKKSGVYFFPKQQGFRITVRSERDAVVAPLGAGLQFASRSALRRDASINPRAPRTATSAGASGVPFSEAPVGPTPPPPSVDADFECAAYLEPTDKGDPRTACAPIHTRR
jgi:hypothetical protein